MYKSKIISENPKLPLISIYKNRGIDIITNETLKYFNRTSAFSLIQAKKENPDAEMFSMEMEVWHLEQKTDKFKNTKWNRFLAKTIHNPSYDVSLIWSKHKTYKLNELKEKIKTCIDLDDDVLTQFIEADFFKYLIEQSSNYTEILNVLNKYYFEIEDEKVIYQENEKWENEKV